MKKLSCLAIFLTLATLSRFVEHQTRTYAQHNKGAYDLMITFDMVTFCINGGDPFTYNNHTKWWYSNWINNPNRTTVEKILFWKIGLFYNTTTAPKEYKYEFQPKSILGFFIIRLIRIVESYSSKTNTLKPNKICS